MVAESNSACRVAYFSMEIGLESAMPTYAGGLGVLAGDTLRAAADLGVPMVAVTLIHRKGYFRQHLDGQGNQTETPVEWSPEALLEPVAPRVSVTLEGRQVWVRAWRYLVRGLPGRPVPVYLLDTRLPENSPWDQGLTDHLYGGDGHYRLCQEAILGLGGVAMLRSLGYAGLQTYHMNEGHSALLCLALLPEQSGTQGGPRPRDADWEAVRRRCVFTTHTPVPAGHDQFPWPLVVQVLGDQQAEVLDSAGCKLDGHLNMTHLGLFSSRYINGVSISHESVSRAMFPRYPIRSITNGVHAATWTSPPFRRLFDQQVPGWLTDSSYLRYTLKIPLPQIQECHREAKGELLAQVERRAGVSLDPVAMTIGFARRAATYKRPELLFHDIPRLVRIARLAGPIQLVFAGKAHPADEGGKSMLRRLHQAAATVNEIIPVVYLEEHDLELARYLCAGVDLWLNTPQRPYEASGTSGMKAALNGVPSLSVLDGWWLEGHVEGVTGWAIGDRYRVDVAQAEEANSLYDKLEHAILPMFYGHPDRYAEVMRYAIALNGWFFTAERMVSQYLRTAYQTQDIW